MLLRLMLMRPMYLSAMTHGMIGLVLLHILALKITARHLMLPQEKAWSCDLTAFGKMKFRT